jgi:hypothetical protein
MYLSQEWNLQTARINLQTTFHGTGLHYVSRILAWFYNVIRATKSSVNTTQERAISSLTTSNKQRGPIDLGFTHVGYLTKVQLRQISQ